MIHGENALNEALKITNAVFTGDVSSLSSKEIEEAFPLPLVRAQHPHPGRAADGLFQFPHPFPAGIRRRPGLQPHVRGHRPVRGKAPGPAQTLPDGRVLRIDADPAAGGGPQRPVRRPVTLSGIPHRIRHPRPFARGAAGSVRVIISCLICGFSFGFVIFIPEKLN